jgi:hypothetical protein
MAVRCEKIGHAAVYTGGLADRRPRITCEELTGEMGETPAF